MAAAKLGASTGLPPGKHFCTAINTTTSVTLTSTATAYLTTGTGTFDGQAVRIEIHIPYVAVGTDNPVAFQLFRDTTMLCQWGNIKNTTGSSKTLTTYDIPAAGDHTYTLKLRSTGVGTDDTVGAGTGGDPADLSVTTAAAYIVVSKA